MGFPSFFLLALLLETWQLRRLKVLEFVFEKSILLVGGRGVFPNLPYFKMCMPHQGGLELLGDIALAGL